MKPWYREHLLLWDWLIRNPRKCKKDWPGWNGRNILNECFACEEALEISYRVRGDDWRCKVCPLKWYKGGTCHELYYGRAICMDVGNYRRAKGFARMIRNAVPKDGKVNRKRMIQWAEKLTVRPARSVK